MKRDVVQYQELVERMRLYDLIMTEEAIVNQFLLGLSRDYDVDRKLLSARDGLSLDKATNILLLEALARDMQKGRHMAANDCGEPFANAADGAPCGERGRGRPGGNFRGGRGGDRSTAAANQGKAVTHVAMTVNGALTVHTVQILY